MLKRTLLILMAAAGLIIADYAQAQTAISPEQGPVVISQPGNYYVAIPGSGFAGGLYNSPAITITANNVLLDLNGWPGPTAYGAQGVVVKSTTAGNPNSVIIKNGAFNDQDASLNVSPKFNYFGWNNAITLTKASTCVIRDCQFRGSMYPITDDTGTNNLVTHCSIQAGINGILFIGCNGDVSSDNQLTGLTSYAIYSETSKGCFFRENVITHGASPYGMVLSAADHYRAMTFLGFPTGNAIISGGVHIVE